MSDVCPKCSELRTDCCADLVRANAERDALAAFKTYVHKRLDEAGVPHDPESDANARHGCRVEGRLNWLESAVSVSPRTLDMAWAERDAHKARAEAAENYVEGARVTIRERDELCAEREAALARVAVLREALGNVAAFNWGAPPLDGGDADSVHRYNGWEATRDQLLEAARAALASPDAASEQRDERLKSDARREQAETDHAAWLAVIRDERDVTHPPTDGLAALAERDARIARDARAAALEEAARIIESDPHAKDLSREQGAILGRWLRALRPPAPSEPRATCVHPATMGSANACTLCGEIVSEPRATTANDVKCRICDYTEQQHATEPRACTSFRAATADGECVTCKGRGRVTPSYIDYRVDCEDCGGSGRAKGGGE